jgi:hypothetical protein
VDFKHKLVIRDKEHHFILIKGAIHQEEIAIVNLHRPNICAPNFIKYILLNLETQLYLNTVVVGDFNTHLSPTDRSSKKKSQKEYSRME